MRKTRRFNGEDGSSVDEKGEKRYTAMPGKGSVEPTKPLPRERIITKEQVEAKGFTNLRDFLNPENVIPLKSFGSRISFISESVFIKYYLHKKNMTITYI